LRCNPFYGKLLLHPRLIPYKQRDDRLRYLPYLQYQERVGILVQLQKAFCVSVFPAFRGLAKFLQLCAPFPPILDLLIPLGVRRFPRIVQVQGRASPLVQ
jgi:hypothetical protein